MPIITVQLCKTLIVNSGVVGYMPHYLNELHHPHTTQKQISNKLNSDVIRVLKPAEYFLKKSRYC